MLGHGLKSRHNGGSLVVVSPGGSPDDVGRLTEGFLGSRNPDGGCLDLVNPEDRPRPEEVARPRR